MEKQKLKKVLILCYDFPPYNSVGAQRPYSWFKYFKKFNLHPVVVTRHWDDGILNSLSYVKPSKTQTVEKEESEFGTIIRVPYKTNIRDRFILKYGFSKFTFIRKALSFYLSIIRFLSFRLDDTASIYLESEKYINDYGCDLIIATGEPFILFKYASLLSTKYNIPFIADYRDGWTINYNNDYTSAITKFITKHLIQKFEKRYLKNVSSIITVSPSYKNDVQVLHPNKEIRVIYNGYDFNYPEFTTNVSQEESTFEITYAGTIYPYQQLELFLEGYRNFILETKCTNSRVVFYGLEFYPEQVERLKSFHVDVNPYLTTTERISHPEVIHNLQKSSILLLLADDQIDGSCAKIFEYLAVNRKILLVKDDKGTLSNMMDECNGGIKCSSAAEVTRSLVQLYKEHQQKGSVSHESHNFIQYSRESQCEALSKIIHDHIGIETSEKKKVMILAYDFPPYISVGGLRPYSWLKYLPEYGIEPIIITRQWKNKYRGKLDYIAPSDSNETIIEKSEIATVIRTPYTPNYSNKLQLKYGVSRYNLLSNIISAYYELVQFFITTGPKSQLYLAAKKYLLNNKVDYIIATGDPFILFKYASSLSKRFDTPWIADYRDPWSLDVSVRQGSFHQVWNSYLEKSIVKSAHLITTTTSFFEFQIATLFKDKNITIIPNGYDPELIDRIKEINQQNEILTLAYVGTIYNWHPIRSFLSVVASFLENNKNTKLKICFYGINLEKELAELLASDFPNLGDVVSIHPRLPNQSILEELAKSNVMILFNYYSNIGTKIYDYVGVNRRILLCYKDDVEANKLKDKYYLFQPLEDANEHVQEDLINHTSSGTVAKNAEHLYQILGELTDEFSKNGFINSETKHAEEFSRKLQTQKLAEILTKGQRPYRQCTRCVMDTTDEDIIFDMHGHCNHCNEYYDKTAKRTYQGNESDQQLARIVSEIKKAGKNKEYDCVLGLSGGIDSCYAAYILHNLGLRTLAVHLDNGWDSETSVKNVKYIVSKLGFGYESYVLDWEEFRDLQLSFLKASVPEAETPTDIAIPAILHEVAAENNIKYIISGGNFATEGILPKSWHYDAKDIKYLKSIHKRYGTKELKTFPTFGYQKEMYYKFVKGIKTIYLLNYVPFGKKEAMKVLEEQLKWKYYGGKHYESKYTGFLQSYILPEKFDLDYRRATLSTQICAGDITREDALEELLQKPYDPIKAEEEKQYVCKKLNISLEEFDSIMNLPPKSYNDYPNSKEMLEFIYSVYRKLFDMN